MSQLVNEVLPPRSNLYQELSVNLYSLHGVDCYFSSFRWIINEVRKWLQGFVLREEADKSIKRLLQPGYIFYSA